MSYTMTLPLGDTTGSGEPECDDFYSGGAERCIGYEESCPDGDKCCPTGSWYNRVYQLKLGQQSLRASAEYKVRILLDMLMRVPPGDNLTGVERYAWDNGLDVSAGFNGAVKSAEAIYHAVLTGSRWRKNTHGVQTDCRNNGWYANYYLSDYWPPARIDALQLVSGGRFSSAERLSIAKSGIAGAPARSKAWWAKATSVVFAVHGGAPKQTVETMPSLKDALTASGGNVEATGWLSTFINVFSKYKTVPTHTMLTKTVPTHTMLTSTLATPGEENRPGRRRAPADTRRAPTDEASLPPPDDASPGAGVAPFSVLVGVSVFAGTAYLAWRYAR